MFQASTADVANDEDSDASDESYYSGLEEEDSSSENEEVFELGVRALGEGPQR